MTSSTSTKGSNPKDLLGAKKVSISKFPAVALIHGSHAMMNGAAKYGPYNWRGNKVIASIYVDAIFRHVMSWFDEREECAEDSGVHHLGHAIASAAILLDAQETGNLVDDRPEPGKAAQVLNRLADEIKKRAEALAQAETAATLQGMASQTKYDRDKVRQIEQDLES